MWVFLYGGYNDLKLNWLKKSGIKPSVEPEKEVRISKEHKPIVITAVEIQNDFGLILHKFDLLKAFNISARIVKFINNYRRNKS